MPLPVILELLPDTNVPVPWSTQVRVVPLRELSQLRETLLREAVDVVVMSEAMLFSNSIIGLSLPVVAIDPAPTAAKAVQAMKTGVVDYVDPTNAERACLEAAQNKKSGGEPITQQLIEREQLMAVGRLAAGVAHEINNPAAFVVANLNEVAVAGRTLEALLRTALPMAFRDASFGETQDLRQLMESAQHPRIFAELRAMVEESLVGMSRIRDIVHNLRGFSINDGEPIVIDLAASARTALDLIRPELRYRARVETALEVAPIILAPKSRISQVLLSMLMNALQAFEDSERTDRGQLTVSTAIDAEGWALLSIEDNGRPLPTALLLNLDDPFAIPHQEDHGVSLRMATSRGIIRRLGGELTVRSDERGTTVVIRLPPHVSNPATPSRSDDNQDPLLTATILVVDNEEPIVRSLRRLLRSAKEVLTATTGEAALDVLLSDSPPDLILCDIIMPDWSGVDLYQHIENKRPELAPRFLFITGGTLSPATEHFRRIHADRVLDKPFEPKELRDRIREALRSL